jgi:predicted MFS family arabinose efflux permease
MLHGKPLVAAMCVGQVGNLLPHVVVPAVMVQHLMPLWGMSNAQAGLLAAAYAAGYMCAVPVLSALTDRLDARLILGWGSFLSAMCTLGFAALADDWLSGMMFWALAGASFAGAYMPGLRALTDRLGDADASRSITLYTSSYSLGVGFSFLVSQLVADAWGWRWSFALTGLGPLVMVAVAWRMRLQAPVPVKSKLLDFRPVLRNRQAMAYILSYGAHCFELYGFRTWVVAFWTFVVARHQGLALPEPMLVSFLASLLAMPASILGNEMSLRYGRQRAVTWIQVASALTALGLGLFAGGSAWLLLVLILIYSVTVPADSGSLTAGMMAQAQAEYKGLTLALHSTVGFGLSALSGWLVGLALDAQGGSHAPEAWLAAFGVLAVGVGLGPLALRLSKAPSGTSAPH